MLVSPILVFEIAAQFSAVFNSNIDEILDGIENVDSELIGLCCFAMAEEAEEGESGHADLLLFGPRSVGVLFALKKVEGFDDGIFRCRVASAFVDDFEPGFFRATIFVDEGEIFQIIFVGIGKALRWQDHRNGKEAGWDFHGVAASLP